MPTHPSTIDQPGAGRPVRTRGRPRTLDDDKCRTICMLVASGFSLMRAAQFVGCAPSTVHRHRRHDEPFDTALREATRAVSARERRILRKPSPDNWRASTWFLDRLKRERETRRGRKTPFCPSDSALELMWILKSFLCNLVRQEVGKEPYTRLSCRIDEEFHKIASRIASRDRQ